MAHRQEDEMETTFKKVTLITRRDEQGVESFYNENEGIWYNDYGHEETENFIRKYVFPSVIIARFGGWNGVELTGDQWCDLQCPIRMTQEQLDAVLANQPAAVEAWQAEKDAWSDKESVELSLPNSPWRISARKTITQCKEGWLDNFGFKYTDEKIAEMFDKWMNPQRSDIEKYIKIEQRGYNVR